MASTAAEDAWPGTGADGMNLGAYRGLHRAAVQCWRSAAIERKESQ